jgi:hypothetical protein
LFKFDSREDDPEKGAVEVEKDKPYPFSYSRLVRESRPELFLIIIGVIAACGNGCVMPIFAIIYSEIVSTFQKPEPSVLSYSLSSFSVSFLV